MFGPTQSNRAGLRPAGAIDLLPAAMGWARRVQRLKNPGHATLRSHIAEVGSRLKAWRRGEAARRRSDQSRDDGWARTRHRPIWTPLDARAPLCLELSGRASSRTGSCGEQHGAQVSAQLPAHPDTTSHAFSVKRTRAAVLHSPPGAQPPACTILESAAMLLRS